MKAMQSTSGSSEPLLSEILTKVNNAKDKPKKISVLKENDSPHLRMVLKAAFDPKIEWDLPKGTPPFIPMKCQSVLSILCYVVNLRNYGILSKALIQKHLKSIRKDVLTNPRRITY